MNAEASEQKQKLAGVFDRTAASYDQVGPGLFSVFGHRLVEIADIFPGADVLDVATGRGASLFAAAERAGSNGRVIGIDLSHEMVKKTEVDAARRGLGNVEVQHMDAEELRFADAAFDFVLCGFALFFFPNLDRALNHFSRVLRPGGRLAVTTFRERDDFLSFMEALMRPYAPSDPTSPTEQPEPSPLSTPEGLEATLREAGLKDIEVVEEEADFVYTDEEEWWALLWSGGYRAFFEAMDVSTLERFKADAFARVQPFKQSDGIHVLLRPLYAVGAKP